MVNATSSLEDLTAAAADPETYLPNICDKSFSLQHLSSRALRLIASSAEAGSRSRASLLSELEQDVRAGSRLSWEVDNGKSALPGRMLGELLSYDDELYVYGGWPTKSFMDHAGQKPFYDENNKYMLKLDCITRSWEPVSFKGAPEKSWIKKHSFAKGAVHAGRLYMVIPTLDPLKEAMRVYDFSKKEWDIWGLTYTPPATVSVLLGVYKDQLIQYGGSLGPLRNWVDAQRALWSFNISTRTWQPLHSTGVMPDPAMCLGLAVVGDHAYVLTNHRHPSAGIQTPDTDRRMEVFVLDLITMQWSQASSQADAPRCVLRASPAVVEGQWLVFGGDGGISANSGGNPLHTFDFATQTWRKAKVTGKPLQERRASFQAACHRGALIVIGGTLHKAVVEDPRAPFDSADVVQCILPQRKPEDMDQSDTGLGRYSGMQDCKRMYKERNFTDVTVEVEGEVWELHKMMLAGCSPLLEDLLHSLLPGEKLVLPDLTADTMSLLVGWIYGDFQDHVGFQQYAALFKAADKFNIEDLRKDCIRGLASLADSDTLPKLAGLAAVYDDCHQLVQACEAVSAKLHATLDTSTAAKGVNHEADDLEAASTTVAEGDAVTEDPAMADAAAVAEGPAVADEQQGANEAELEGATQADAEEAPQADPQKGRRRRWGGWRRVARNVVKGAAAVAVACTIGAVAGSLAAPASKSRC